MKGKQGEECNRTACQAPKSANYYNRITDAWYCLHCAKLIEAVANRDGNSFYPQLKKDKNGSE